MKFNFKEFLGSKTFKNILIGIGGLIVALLIFQAGEFIGYRKASFSYSFGERYYHEAFGRGGRPSGLVGMNRMMDEFSETHGAVGKIIKAELPNLTLEGQDNIEKNILLNASTTIRAQRDNLKPEDLKVGDTIMVIGAPNDKAEIEARLIRVLPANLK